VLGLLARMIQRFAFFLAVPQRHSVSLGRCADVDADADADPAVGSHFRGAKLFCQHKLPL